MIEVSMVLIPIVMFTMIGVVTLGGFWLLYQSRRDHHETIRQAIDLGQPLDETFHALLNGVAKGPSNDLRAALVSACLGGAFIVVSCLNWISAGSQLATRIGIAVGVLILGFALGMWLSGRSGAKASNNSPQAQDKIDT
jgi:Domain of unknown function (DUF6249)